MKTTMYFKTVEEMENYFPDGVPNNILAVIEGEGSNMLFTSTNNTEQGEAVEQGGEPISEEDRELVNNTLYGGPTEDGWYLVGDTGNLYKFEDEGEAVTYNLQIETTNWDLPGYILSVKNGKETNWYPAEDTVYSTSQSISIYDDDKYAENRITIAKGGTLKLDGSLSLKEYVPGVSDTPVLKWYGR